MSGKTKKKNKVTHKSSKLGRAGLWLGIAVAGLILALVVCLWLYLWKFGFPGSGEVQPTQPTNEITSSTTQPADEPAPTEPEATYQANIGELDEVNIVLGSGLGILDVGSYTGIFMEDGSDEVVSGVLMAVVTNRSDRMCSC